MVRLDVGLMAALIDAEQLYTEGTLNPVILGLTRRYQREGRTHDLVAEVAVPVLRLSDRLRGLGESRAADLLLAHAVHNGLVPSMLQEASVMDTNAAKKPIEALAVGHNPAANGAVNLEAGAWIAARHPNGLRDVNLIRVNNAGRIEFGQARPGAPPPATTAATAITLVNYLRAALIDAKLIE